MATRDFQYDIGGLTTLVCVLYLDGGTTMVNASTGAAFAATAANLNTAAIACSDSARAGQYRYTIPASTAAGTYNELFYVKRTNGSTLVQADTVSPYGPEGVGQFEWSGTTVVTGNTLAADIAGIDAGGGFSFTGAFARTFTINNGSTAIPSALVRVTQGVQSELRQTDINGQCSFSLDAGTYTVSVTKQGYSLSPASLTVSASASTTYSMAAVTIDPPSSPDTVTAYLYCYDSDGVAASGIDVSFRLIVGPGQDAAAHDGDSKTATSGVSGLLQTSLLANSQYEARRGSNGQWYSFATDDGPSYSIPEIIGRA